MPTKAALRKIARDIRNAAALAAAEQANVAELYSRAKTEHHLNTWALRLAIKLASQEPLQGQQAFHDLKEYCDKLGLFDQGNLESLPDPGRAERRADQRAEAAE